MRIQITSTNIRYRGGEVDVVNVHFQGGDQQGTITLNGYVPLSAEEYSGNEALPKLTEAIREKLIERLSIEEAEIVTE